jgi:DNA-binding CsgD family transcriptional regulator
MMASTGYSWEGENVRLLPAPLNPTLTLLSPHVNQVQVRRLLRLGIILRWVAIAFAGLAGVLSAKPPPLLFYLMLAALIYNLAVMVAAGQATDTAARRLALATTVIDQFFDLGFIVIYAGALPTGDQVAPYVPGLIEAVAYFGIVGAILSVTIFFGFTALLDAGSAYLGHTAVSPSWVLGATLIVALIGATLVPVIGILTAPVDATELAPGLRLSKREHEVLRLVAEGYSNTMIASRLNLSDNTVKSYVESLLTRLNARNRAEAVAAASRLKLI